MLYIQGLEICFCVYHYDFCLLIIFNAFLFANFTGGVGLIISEGVHIDNVHAVDGKLTPSMVELRQSESWKAVTAECHKYNTRFVMQLWHTGMNFKLKKII